MTTAHAIAFCSRLTKAHSSTFYLGSRLFPKQQRDAVHAVYAMCRSGDDAVDECADALQGQQRLAQWWQHVEHAYADQPRSNEPLEVALHWALQHYSIPKAAFEELYMGFKTDLQLNSCYESQAMADMDALMTYCRRVAGVVGFMVAPIAGYRGGDETLQQALALGQAMQLTNILRDVGEDLGRSRCYLPKDKLQVYAVDIPALQRGVISEGYVALLEDLTGVAHSLYRQGWQGIPKLHGSAAVAVGVAALNYEGILRKLRQNHYDNLTRRAYLKTHERLVLIPQAVYSVYSTSLMH